MCSDISAFVHSWRRRKTEQMVKEKVRKTILQHKLITRGEHIVVGLSGGPDSVCLFYTLKGLMKELDFSLSAVHVNHGFRPGEAEADQYYVEELCRKEGIPCTSFQYDCRKIAQKEGLSSEGAGRKVRYSSFRQAAAALVQKGLSAESIKIAVAQNAQDQAETVLLHLLRGSGTDGLAGMSYCRREGDFQIIRPLLDVSREEIEACCREEKLNPRIDQTNLQPVYTRNKVRLGLIPYLKEAFNPNIIEALIRLSKTAEEDKTYLWERAEQVYSRLVQEDGTLEREELSRTHDAVRHRVIRKAFQHAGLDSDISRTHLEAADRLLAGKQDTGMLDFPGGYIMELRYGKVKFCKKREKENFQAAARLKITTGAPQELQGQHGAVFDWEKLCSRYENPQIVLRTRQAGDYIRLKKGRKKLQDFFVDQKVPKEERDSILLAAVGSEILWAAASEKGGLKRHRYSEKYKLDETTKVALLLEIICEI